MGDNSIIDDLLAATRPDQYTVLATDDWSGLECAPLVEAAVSLGQEVVTVEHSWEGGNYTVNHDQGGYRYRLMMSGFGNPFHLIHGSVRVAVPVRDCTLIAIFDEVQAGDVREVVEGLGQDLQVLRLAAIALNASDDSLYVLGGDYSKTAVIDRATKTTISVQGNKRQVHAVIAELKVLHQPDGALRVVVDPPDWGRGWDVPNTGKVLDALIAESGGVFTGDGNNVLDVHLPAPEGV